MKQRWEREHELAREVVWAKTLTAAEADKILYDEYGGSKHSITLYIEKLDDM